MENRDLKIKKAISNMKKQYSILKKLGVTLSDRYSVPTFFDNQKHKNHSNSIDDTESEQVIDILD